jgi:hypothetical protein
MTYSSAFLELATKPLALPWMGDIDLPWPVAMNLEEAPSALREAGFGSEYKRVTLRRPVYPSRTAPHIIFGTANAGGVGTVTLKVFHGNWRGIGSQGKMRDNFSDRAG